jgi:N1-aminopropylagmatine ureohydrolase
MYCRLLISSWTPIDNQQFGAISNQHSAFLGSTMSFPFYYEHSAPMAFGGMMPTMKSFDESRVVILPVPVDRTTSYVSGTRNGPREILEASSHMELWDEEVGADVHGVGIFTLPTMELPFGEMAPLLDEIKRVAAEILSRDKFLVTLGGEHSITPPLVAATAAAFKGLSVLQIDAHADLRDCYMGTPHNHACAMRRSLEYAPVTQVGIRSLSTEEAEAAPTLNTKIFYDATMRNDPKWIDRVVDSLTGPVYITIDVDGMDPAIMPATGTPEPGGLSWYEMLALLRATIAKKPVVACDVVELSPLPGLMAPNFLCAKLIYKILTYRFAR